MARLIRVGFFSAKNYLDQERDSFSGAIYRMQRALRNRNAELVCLGRPHLTRAARLMRRWSKRISSLRARTRACRKFAEFVAAQLEISPCDVIFAPLAMRSLCYLQTKTPIVYMTDATPELLYQGYRHAYRSEHEYQLCEQWEAEVNARAASVIYTSQYAADSATRRYGVDARKINIVPFGPNIDRVPSPQEILQRVESGGCDIVLIGKDWHRKGADTACQS